MELILAIAVSVIAIGAVIVRVDPPATVIVTPSLLAEPEPTGLDPDYCAGCGHIHRQGAMAFTTRGAYRCRVCCYGKEL